MLELDNSFFSIVYNWLSSSGLKIIILIVIAAIINRFSRLFIERSIRKIIVSSPSFSKIAEKKREDTLIKIISGVVNVVVVLVVVLIILQELNVEIGPILAAAGIAGLAFGFGGQYLIKDLISGLFIILENQYRVGDVVCFDSTCGLVEDISLRMTSLRNMDGTVHHVPHGEIKKVSNLTKSYSRVNLDIGVSYDSNLEEVISVVNQVGKELSEDPVWKDSIITPPQFLRVEDLGDSAVIIKILGDTKPIKQWEVAGELRKRIKIAFDNAKIEIPFPQRVIHHANKIQS